MSSLDFTHRLYKALNKDSEKENVFFSPYSISSALSMVLTGAKKESKEQLLLGLGFADVDQAHQHYLAVHSALSKVNESVKLTVANKIFPDASTNVKADYIRELRGAAFKCDVTALDFVKEAERSRLEINRWVSDETHEKIKDLLPEGSVDKNTVMVLANAIYFKGAWENEFDSKRTRLQKFYCADKSETDVKMMTRKAKFKSNYDRDLKLQSLEIPYKGKDISMCLFLPDSRFGLGDVEKQLNADKMNDLIDQGGVEKVVLTLPKFSVEYQKDLLDSMKALGVSDIFDSSKADLSGISDDPNLIVSSVAHKAFIEVNEEGTEAAAATAVMIFRSCMPLPPIEFTCDHPFVFTIRHNASKQILFFGKVAILD